jgi:hypothetical protein
MSKLGNLGNELKASHAHAKRLQDEIDAIQDASDHRVNHSIPLPRTGIDYAFAPHPPADKLRSAGITFVCRYLTGPGKLLTYTEALDISAQGIDLVALYETTGTTFKGGFAEGRADAKIAIHALDVLKPHGNPPIIFTCDADVAGEGLTGTAMEYIRGAVSEIGWHRVGLYAGYEPIITAYRENRCKYLFQTYAWSGGKWSPNAQLRQVQNGIHLFGADCDLDKAVAADFGQFRV